ncbi:probable small intestine urate exporter isoform X2 [Artibeus jamaicensis]|uniref:probable small intestine urate exporter isoform X2 n=1 Tax=Artibeus jamaicensis TaxID=9417 RepID=UPI00235AFEEE|nr:probable small intestine urate exporter isoform X2 [Artibeus jamaicensis]
MPDPRGKGQMSPKEEAPGTGGDRSRDADVRMVSSTSKGFCSVRHGLALILQFCNFTLCTQNMNLSIALPAMVNSSVLPCPANGSDARDTCNETLPGFWAADPVYDWSPDLQGVILSALNCGSFLASIPCGYVAGLFAAKQLIGASLCVSSVVNLLIPHAADAGAALLIVLRVVQGVAQIIVMTSQYEIWLKWAPPLERNQLIIFSISGSALGACSVVLAGGFLCETLGWPSVFYVSGGIGCACVCLWFPLVYDDPEYHPFISARERDYIVCSLALQDRVPYRSLPMKAMLKSLPLWSILVSHFSVWWYISVITAYLPTYLHSVLAVSLSDSGFLSALMLGAIFVCTILGGLLADVLFSRKVLSLLVIRRLFTAIGVLFSSLFSVSLSWVSDSFSISIAFLVLSLAASSFCQVGSLVNFMDIAPRYSGFLKGLSLVFTNLSGVIAPTVSGFFISQDTESGWRNIFLLSAAINLPGLVFFLVLSRADEQEWAKDQMLTRL